MREDKVGHGQDSRAALCEKFAGFSYEALRATHREMEMERMRSDEDSDDFL